MDEETRNTIERLTTMDQRLTQVEADVRNLYVAWKLPWWWWLLIFTFMSMLMIALMSDTTGDIADLITYLSGLVTGGKAAE